MDSTELRQQLRAVMTTAFGLAPGGLPENACMDSVAQWDSLGHLTLVGAIEERFGVTFSHGEMIELLDEQHLLDALADRPVNFSVVSNHA